MRKLVLASFLSYSLVGNALAHDLGVVGATHPIDEVNMFAAIALEAGRVDWEEVNQGIAKDAKNELENLPFTIKQKTQERKLRLVDPTVTLKEDIVAPSVEGKEYLIGRTGQKVNPLDYGKPTTKMFFFDPDDEDQMEAALFYQKEHPRGVYLVAVGGNIIKLAEKLNRPVFYAWPWMVERFNLQVYPSLMGTIGNRIGIAEIDSLEKKSLREAWNDLD